MQQARHYGRQRIWVEPDENNWCSKGLINLYYTLVFADTLVCIVPIFVDFYDENMFLKL